MAVDRHLVANLLILDKSDEFAPFRTWLQERREYWRDVTECQKDTDTLRQAQGHAQAYKEILELLGKSTDLSEKYRG